METAALAVAVLALLVALAARSTARAQAQAVEDARAEGRRRTENLREELEQALSVVREHLAQVSEGALVSREMIVEGRVWEDVSPEDGVALVERGGVRLLDVRSPQETAGGVIPGALLIPIEELEERVGELPQDGAPTLVYCAAGGRSAAACEYLSSRGYTGLRNLQGGIGSWSGPVARPS